MTRQILVSGTLPTIERQDLETETGIYIVDPLKWRVHDNLSSLLPNSAGSDDLGLISGAYGTNTPAIQSSDGASTNVTQYARLLWQAPPEFVSGGNIQVRVHAKMQTVSDSSASVDLSAYESNREKGLGSDLVTTSATSINNATYADYNFTINPTGVAPGDLLDVRMTVAITDSATGSGVVAEIGEVQFRIDVRG